MKKLVFIAILGLTACAEGPFAAPAPANVTVGAEVKTPPEGSTVTAPPPPPSARTEDALDTTSAEERQAAVAAGPDAGEKRLGETIATLGAPTDPGIWLETPLVDQITQGRVEAKANGKSVKLELRPIDGPDGAGSRISLPALRLLEVGLAGLHELVVFSG